MDKYAIVLCAEDRDFFVNKKDEIRNAYRKEARPVSEVVSFGIYTQSSNGSIYIYDQALGAGNLILVKDDEPINKQVELFIYTCDTDWGNEIQRANFKGTIYDGLLYVYNNKDELCEKHKNDS